MSELNIKIGIVGNGHVAIGPKLFQCQEIDVFVYDLFPEKCSPLGTTLADVSQCDLIFLCVPTPFDLKKNTCYLDNVLNCGKMIKEYNPTAVTIVRSTVIPGTSNQIEGHFMPEYLPERFLFKFTEIEEYNFGLNLNHKDNELFKTEIHKLFDIAYKNKIIKHHKICFYNNNELEMEKYVTNSILAVNVSFFNEIENYCCANNINYQEVTQIFDRDQRIFHKWFKIPGPDGQRGYGGTCLPKDIEALHGEYMKQNLKSYILKAAIDRNNELDRPEKDWQVMNRTVI
jgi:UDPglucose 6-dehydrogenase